MPPFLIRFYGPDQLLQILAQYGGWQPAPWLLSPAAAAGRWGLGWWGAMLNLAPGQTLVLDCATSPGLCLAALRQRIPHFCADLPPELSGKIQQMAACSSSQFWPGLTQQVRVVDLYEDPPSRI